MLISCGQAAVIATAETDVAADQGRGLTASVLPQLELRKEVAIPMTRIFLFVVLSWASVSVQGQALNPKYQFPVFDATGFTQKPDLTQFGLKTITVVYPAFMWDGDKGPDPVSLPDRGRIAAFAQIANQSTGILVVDIEHWPLTGGADAVAESIQKYQTVIKWFKAPSPSLKVGLSRVVPIRDYWDSLQEGTPRYATWQKISAASHPSGKLADVLFPSFIPFMKIVMVGQSMPLHRFGRHADMLTGSLSTFSFGHSIMSPTKSSPIPFCRATTGVWSSILRESMLTASSSGVAPIGKRGMARRPGGWKPRTL